MKPMTCPSTSTTRYSMICCSIEAADAMVGSIDGAISPAIKPNSSTDASEIIHDRTGDSFSPSHAPNSTANTSTSCHMELVLLAYDGDG